MRKHLQRESLITGLWSGFLLALCLWAPGIAQENDSLQSKKHEGRSKADALNVLLYSRFIADASGNLRVDENIVANFKLTSWMRIEAGFRQGERPQQFDSYYHYKIELQTKSFWKSVRFIARLSENVIKYPPPVYTKSNYLFIAEGKYPLSGHFTAMAALGYVFTYQVDGSQDARPSTQGTQNFYPTFKFALRYAFRDRGFVEAVYGAYDVFNPYLLSSPFAQVAADYEISKRVTLYTYFRYQFNNEFTVPLNEFLGLGVRLHFIKS
jgi:hypothetical protein